ncbi:Hypothetical protein PBC10988_26730 [Planctomycetales bacterium 10988]|nr:Hypothetical protein PBC10988_26730 [Planctomycetales bacterium 10988]
MPKTKEATKQPTAGKEPIRVCLLGSEGSGKTCFLAGLAILGEPNRPSNMTVSPADTTTANYMDELATTLRRQEWPPPTNLTNVLKLRICIEQSLIDIVIVDYPGEDFRRELRKLTYDQIETLYEQYSKADAILLLFDPHHDLPSDAPNRELQIERQEAHLKAIANIWAERSQNKVEENPRKTDVAIILTKSDTVDSLGNSAQARRYFRKHAPFLDQKIRTQADEVGYFPVTAVGHAEEEEWPDGVRSIPSRDLEPAGYDPLFQWIRKRHSQTWKKVKRVLLGTALLAGMLAAAAGIYSYYQHERSQNALAILNNPEQSTLDKLESTAEEEGQAVVRQRKELLQEELSRLQEQLDAADEENRLATVMQELEQYRQARPGILEDEVEQLLRSAEEKQQAMLYQKVKTAFDYEPQGFFSLAMDFLQAYPSSSRCDDVREMITLYDLSQQENARQRIRSIAVQSRTDLSTKSQRIQGFLQEFEDRLTAEEKQKMHRAAELGRQFSERRDYTVRLKRSGGFRDPYSQGVWLYIGGQLVKEYNSPGASRNVTWNANRLNIQWQSGDAVKIVLRDRSYNDENVAWTTDRGPLALKILSEKQFLNSIDKDWTKTLDEPFIHFTVDGITSEDWEIAEAYLMPGEAW